jgi:hypothetical protein
MHVLVLKCAVCVIVVCFSLASATSHAEEERLNQWQNDAAGVQFDWQPSMQQPMQNGSALQLLAQEGWQLHMQQPMNARFTWQAQQPTNVVWGLVAAAHSNPLGVEVAPTDAVLYAQLGLEDEKGVVVTSVRSDSEAEKSGLRTHDLILRIGETSIESAEAFNEAVTSEQGNDAEFQIVRQGKRVTLPIKVPQTRIYEWTAQPNQFATLYDFAGKQYRLGLVLAEADPTLRSQLRLDDGRGLVVTQVLPDTPAAEADLHEHDILIELDGKPLTAVEDLNAQVQEIKDRKVGVKFLRGGDEMQIEIAPQLESGPLAANTFRLTQPMQQMQWFDYGHFTPANAGFVWSTQAAGEDAEGTQASAADQVAALQKQLAAMQQSLARLQAALKPAEEPQQDDDEQKQDE